MFEDFDKVFVVSLPGREDRRRQFESHNWPFDYEWFEAIDGKKFKPPRNWGGGEGAWGCFLSHLKILELQIQKGWKKVFIFEDDAKPAPQFLEKTTAFLQSLPPSWHQIYLGGLHRYVNQNPPMPVNTEVLKCQQVNWTHAYGVTLEYAKKLHAYLWETFAEHPSQYHVDWRYEVMHPKHNVYAPVEWTVYQGGSTSDVLRNNKFMKVKGSQPLPHIRPLQTRDRSGFGFILITGDGNLHEVARSMRFAGTQMKPSARTDIDRFVSTHTPEMDADILEKDLTKLWSLLASQRITQDKMLVVHEGLLPYVPVLSQIDPDLKVLDIVGKNSDNTSTRRSVYQKVGTNFRHRFELKDSFRKNLREALQFLGLNMTHRMMNAEVRRSEKWYGDQH
jgi:hypothetical protein